MTAADAHGTALPLDGDGDGVDDGVYHPDQSVRVSAHSLHSLEPLVEGPTTLKAIFYDPSWSLLQKRCVIAVLLVLLISSFSIIIALFVGLGRVVSYIKLAEKVKEYGLHTIPDSYDDTYYFCRSGQGQCDNTKIDDIVKEYDRVLADYEEARKTFKEQNDFENCSDTASGPSKSGSACFFDPYLLGNNCTSEKKYGFTSGNPCILLTMREVDHDFYPTSNGARLSWIPITCSAGKDAGQIDVFPSRGFQTNTIFRPKEMDVKNKLWPLVFVQVQDVQHVVQGVTVSCQADMTNTHEMPGLTATAVTFVGAVYDPEFGNEI